VLEAEMDYDGDWEAVRGNRHPVSSTFGTHPDESWQGVGTGLQISMIRYAMCQKKKNDE